MEKHCVDHSGHDAEIKTLMKFRDKMDGNNGNPGVLSRMGNAIDEKMELKLGLSLLTAVLVIVGTSYGLLFYSTREAHKDIAKIATSVAVIEKQLEIEEIKGL